MACPPTSVCTTEILAPMLDNMGVFREPACDIAGSSSLAFLASTLSLHEGVPWFCVANYFDRCLRILMQNDVWRMPLNRPSAFSSLRKTSPRPIRCSMACRSLRLHKLKTRSTFACEASVLFEALAPNSILQTTPVSTSTRWSRLPASRHMQ